MKRETKYGPNGKLQDTPVERLDEIYTAFETETACDCCGGYNEHQFEGITTKLTAQELVDVEVYAEFVLGCQLLEGMMERSEVVAGCLLVNSNVEDITFGRAVLESLYVERTHRNEVINKAFPAKTLAGVN